MKLAGRIAPLLLLTGALLTPTLAAPPDALPSGPGADTVIAFAFQAARQTPNQWDARWPLTPADIAKGFQPTEAWPESLRQFAVARMAEEAKRGGDVARWLAEPSPWAGTQMRFDILPSVGYGNKYGTYSTVTDLNGGYTTAQLAAFLDTLSSVRRAEFIRQGMSFPLAKLTGEQRARLFPAFQNDDLRVNGTPLRQLPGARATLSFQFNVFVARVKDGKTQWFQAVFSHLYHLFSSSDPETP